MHQVVEAVVRTERTRDYFRASTEIFQAVISKLTISEESLDLVRDTQLWVLHSGG